MPDGRQPETRRTREAEVDLVGYEGRRLVLAGEAKWSRGPEDGAALEQLRRTVVHVPGHDARWTKLVLYARDGFTARLRERAHDEGVILRSVEDLYA